MGHESRIRVVRRFIAILGTSEYKYTNDDTTERLVGLTYNAIYSLSRINTDDWEAFLIMFKNAKIKALSHVTNQQQKEDNYNAAVALLLATFEKYISYLQVLDSKALAQRMNTVS